MRWPEFWRCTKRSTSTWLSKNESKSRGSELEKGNSRDFLSETIAPYPPSEMQYAYKKKKKKKKKKKTTNLRENKRLVMDDPRAMKAPLRKVKC